MRRLFFLMSISLLSLCSYSQTEDYFVKISGDTVFGKIKAHYYKKNIGNVYKIITPDGQKVDVLPSSAMLIFFKGDRYDVLDINKSNPKKNRKDFHKVIREKGDVIIYGRETYNKSGAYVGGWNTTVSVYLRDDFLYNISPERLKELLPEYKGGCDRFLRECKYNKKIWGNEIVELFDNFCN